MTCYVLRGTLSTCLLAALAFAKCNHLLSVSDELMKEGKVQLVIDDIRKSIWPILFNTVQPQEKV